VEAHPDDVGEQIAEKGVAVIPTFAGNYMLTEAQLKEIAGESVQLEAVAH
jgi:hypothetical protein